MPSPLSPLTDAALAAACCATPPDRAAWDELYARLAGVVRARLAHAPRLYDDTHVDDLVQEVFVRLARGGVRAFRGDSLVNYVLSIADHVRISENRRLRAQRRDVARTASLDDSEAVAVQRAVDTSARRAWEGDSIAGAASGGEDPETSAWRALTARRLDAALATVRDPRDRAVVDDYFLREPPLTDREIGERMRMPLHTVTWRRRRALAQMRAALEGGPTNSPADGVPPSAGSAPAGRPTPPRNPS